MLLVGKSPSTALFWYATAQAASGWSDLAGQGQIDLGLFRTERTQGYPQVSGLFVRMGSIGTTYRIFLPFLWRHPDKGIDVTECILRGRRGLCGSDGGTHSRLLVDC